MSQALTPKNVANRRKFLALAVVGTIVPISDRAFARDRHNHSKATAARSASRDRKTFETAVALRDLWLGHIFWVRNVSVAGIEKNEPAIKAAEQQAVAN